MSIIDRIVENLTRTDILDLYFVQTDLKDMYISPEERAEMNSMGAVGERVHHGDAHWNGHGGSRSGDVPLGKQVW